MANCTSCGLPVPDGQSICSMCYGDIDYGNDGYYRQAVEESLRRQDQEEYNRQQAQQEKENE